MGALPKSWSWLETAEVRVVKCLCMASLVQGPQVTALHHQSLLAFLVHRAQSKASGRNSSHTAITSLLHAQHKGSLMNLKDTSVGIKAAGIENGIFPLVETCDFLLQVLVYALKRRKEQESTVEQYMFLLAPLLLNADLKGEETARFYPERVCARGLSYSCSANAALKYNYEFGYQKLSRETPSAPCTTEKFCLFFALNQAGLK